MSPFLIAACGPVIFVVVALLLGAVTPSYNAIKQTVSEPTLGKFGAVQTINFALSGLLIFTIMPWITLFAWTYRG